MRSHLLLVILALLATSLPSLLALPRFRHTPPRTDTSSTRHVQRPWLMAPSTSTVTFADCGSSDAIVHTSSDPKLSFILDQFPLLSGAWTFTTTERILNAVVYVATTVNFVNGTGKGADVFDWLPALHRTSDGSGMAPFEPLVPDTYTYLFSQWSPYQAGEGDSNQTFTIVNGAHKVIGCFTLDMSG